MIEVDYGGGGHRTRLGTINLCVFGCSPAPIYKGARGEAGRPLQGAPGGGVLLLVGVGKDSPFLLLLGGGKEGGEGEGRRGRKGGKGDRPPSPIQFELGGPRALP